MHSGPHAQVAFEMQAGFRPERGAIVGLFAVMVELKKRQEHGPESHGVYMDLVKAFGTVNRKNLNSNQYNPIWHRSQCRGV